MEANFKDKDVTEQEKIAAFYLRKGLEAIGEVCMQNTMDKDQIAELGVTVSPKDITEEIISAMTKRVKAPLYGEN